MGVILLEVFNIFYSFYNITSFVILNIFKTDNVDFLGGDIFFNGREVVFRIYYKIYYWMVSNGDYFTILNNIEFIEVF